MKLYYSIWADLLILFSRGPSKNWKTYAFALITFIMSFNLAIIMVIVQRSCNVYFYKINFSPNIPFREVLNFGILFYFPPLGINYILILYKDKYKDIIKNYKYRNGTYFLRYFLISFSFPFVLFLLYYLLNVIY